MTAPSSARPGRPLLGRPPARLARRMVVALGVGLALVLTGCSGPKHQTSESVVTTMPDDVPKGAVPFYTQALVWEDCSGGFECARAQVPLDWDDPQEDEAIEIALLRLPARGDPIGSLLLNPGGPGASGIDLLRMATNRFGEALRESFDLVGFDPRGVGQSSAVDCGPAEVVDSVLVADITLESQEDVEVARKIAREFGAECAQRTGELLGHVDTVSAARDLDVLRAVLGDAQLYYLGYSYGTALGATYAELYPDRVGRLVLDGALEPGMTADQLSLEQAEGFESALRAYVTDCQAGRDCPLRGSVEDGLQQVADLIARAEDNPIPVGDGELVNGTLAFYGVVTPLYYRQLWPLLTQALGDAIRENDASLLLQLANSYLGRGPDGEYINNSMVAFTAINCLDIPAPARTFEEMEAFAEQVAEVAPTFADFFAYSVGCESWPYEPKGRPGPVTAAGAEPILVIGTTNDPATPYDWAVALADQLESGRLLTYQGEGHTAYGQANDCVHDAVEAYLVEGVLPEEGLTC